MLYQHEALLTFRISPFPVDEIVFMSAVNNYLRICVDLKPAHYYFYLKQFSVGLKRVTSTCTALAPMTTLTTSAHITALTFIIKFVKGVWRREEFDLSTMQHILWDVYKPCLQSRVNVVRAVPQKVIS